MNGLLQRIGLRPGILDALEPVTPTASDRTLRRIVLAGEVVEYQLVGGVTAHAIPMTTSESSELFVYDIAVRADVQRQGIGRALMTALRAAATAEGIGDMFVPADNEDTHALDFYRGLGGVPTPVTFFTFEGDPE